jgi:hypothetical protein
MSKAPRKRTAANDGWNPTAQIGAVTDAIERVGADNAFYATIIVLSFGLVFWGTSVLETVFLDASLSIIWIAIKLFNERIKERRTRFELECLREARGLELLKTHGKHPDQLSFLDRDK